VKRVYQAANLIDAQLMRDALLAEGIECAIHGSYLSGAAGELPVDATPSVWVLDDGDLARARRIAAELERSAGDTRDWRCTQCGELLAASFQYCWNCNAPKP